jgi:hypothetical protein
VLEPFVGATGSTISIQMWYRDRHGSGAKYRKGPGAGMEGGRGSG